MWTFLRLWLASLCVLPALAIHASEAGVVDWYKPLIGDALTGNPNISPVFHRIAAQDGQTRSLILTATASNVLAALHPENGTIGALLCGGISVEKLTMYDKFSMETSVRRWRPDIGVQEA